MVISCVREVVLHDVVRVPRGETNTRCRSSARNRQAETCDPSHSTFLISIALRDAQHVRSPPQPARLVSKLVCLGMGKVNEQDRSQNYSEDADGDQSPSFWRSFAIIAACTLAMVSNVSGNA